MSAEVLREAATEIREDAAYSISNESFFRAVADWLDREAELSETLQKHGARGVTGIREHPALAVARAYLGDPEPPTVA